MRRNEIQKLFLCLSIAFLAALPLWRYVVLLELEKIPSDFSLKAELFSVDNFFDSEKNDFKGEEISKSLLTINVSFVQEDVLLLDTVFDVETLSGEQIFRAEKQFGVDAKTGKNVPGYGDQDREGFFLFPKHAEKKSYTFWHYSFTKPVLLDFVGEEILHNLQVYHYTGSLAEQKGIHQWEVGIVPEDTLIFSKVQVNVWIEPTSGYFVKLRDTGETFYHDPVTKQMLFPKNKYSNTFADDTIANQVLRAYRQKQSIILYEQLIPILLGMIAFAFFITFIISKKLGLPLEE